MKTSLFAVLLCLAILEGCPSGEIKPVDVVLDEDSCSVCFMAVSLRKFAAETVTRDGQVDYYDDLGCLVSRAKRDELPADSRSFVTDFGNEQWLDASEAYYVQSAGLPTPMSYGLAALDSRSAAEDLARQYEGRVLSWEQLLEEFKP